MRDYIYIFDLLRETNSYEGVKNKAIEQIKSNPKLLYHIDIYDGIVDEKIAKLIADIIFGDINKDTMFNYRGN